LGVSIDRRLKDHRHPSISRKFISWLQFSRFFQLKEGYRTPAFVLNPHAWSAENHVGSDQTKRFGRGRHTTRAALTGLRKRGYGVAIDRSDDKRGSFYRISAGETGLVEGPANSETARRKEQGGSEPQAHQAA
jgi:hypothetical protein